MVAVDQLRSHYRFGRITTIRLPGMSLSASVASNSFIHSFYSIELIDQNQLKKEKLNVVRSNRKIRLVQIFKFSKKRVRDYYSTVKNTIYFYYSICEKII